MAVRTAAPQFQTRQSHGGGRRRLRPHPLRPQRGQPTRPLIEGRARPRPITRHRPACALENPTPLPIGPIGPLAPRGSAATSSPAPPECRLTGRKLLPTCSSPRLLVFWCRRPQNMWQHGGVSLVLPAPGNICRALECHKQRSCGRGPRSNLRCAAALSRGRSDQLLVRPRCAFERWRQRRRIDQRVCKTPLIFDGQADDLGGLNRAIGRFLRRDNH